MKFERMVNKKNIQKSFEYFFLSQIRSKTNSCKREENNNNNNQICFLPTLKMNIRIATNPNKKVEC